MFLYFFKNIYIKILSGWAAQHDPFVLGPVPERPKIAFGPAVARPTKLWVLLQLDQLALVPAVRRIHQRGSCP
jgi:hypothetical protein